MTRATERLDDCFLVERVAVWRDRRALARLYQRHRSTLYTVALLVLFEAEEAEQAVAWAFREAWRYAGAFDPSRGSVGAWLAAITRACARALLLTRSLRLPGPSSTAGCDRLRHRAAGRRGSVK